MNSKNRLRLYLWVVSLMVPLSVAASFISATFMQADSSTPAVTIPAAPTELTATYSTANLGQREVVLTVKDNATNETYYQLYWHLSGTAWPNTAPNDTYNNSSTWSQPANIGRMQIFAPTVGGTYEYQINACNTAGCSQSNIALVNVPGTAVSNVCTSLVFTLVDNKASNVYSFGDFVNYSYKCIPEGTSAPSVAIQVVKPDGTATTYNTGGNIGAVLQQMGFSTSNFTNGSYILRACLNDTSCTAAGSVYPISFTVIGAPTSTQTPATPAATTPATPPTSTTVPLPNNQNSTTGVTQTPTTTPATVIPQTSTIPQTQPTATSLPTSIATPTTTPTAIPQNPTAPQTTQTAPTPSAPSTPSIPSIPPQVQPTLTSLSGAKCTRYLSAIKTTLNSNERATKNIRQKMRNAPKGYVNTDAVTTLLEDADSAIGDMRDLIKNKECSQPTLETIRDKQDDINNALQDLAGYNRDEFQYFGAYMQCQSTLANRTKKINALAKKGKNKEAKSSLQNSISEIAQKSQEFAKDAASASFPEVINQCRSYTKGVDDDINFYLRTGTGK